MLLGLVEEVSVTSSTDSLLFLVFSSVLASILYRVLLISLSFLLIDTLLAISVALSSAFLALSVYLVIKFTSEICYSNIGYLTRVSGVSNYLEIDGKCGLRGKIDTLRVYEGRLEYPFFLSL